MKKTQKRILLLLLVLSLMSIHIPSFVYADWNSPNYETRTENILAKGVTHEHVQRFTDKGCININVLRVDISDEYNKLDVVFNTNNLGQKLPLSQIFDKYPNMVGAVNADFFNMSLAGSLGPMVSDGRLISNPFYIPEQMAVFNLTKDKVPFICHWFNANMTLINQNTGGTLPILVLNKHSNYHDTAVAFTPDWGETTPPTVSSLSNAGAIEMTIENNHVTNIQPAGQGTYIPRNGYVIWAVGSYATNLRNTFAIGNQVNLEMDTNPNFNDLAMAVGGGAILAKDGQPQTNFSHNITGKHPRTAIGISQNQKEIILATVDGRANPYVGVTQQEMAEIMVYLGAHEALNLDGGGSTEMIVRPIGEQNKEIVNNLSDKWERRILNGVGIINTAPKTGIIDTIQLYKAEENVFVDNDLELTIKARDTHYYPTSVEYDKVNWSVTGVEGTFDNNIFKPTTAGKATITAEYQGKTNSVTLNVLDDPVNIIFSPASIALDKGEELRINAFGVDNKGNKAPIKFENLDLDVPEQLGTLDSKGVFRASLQGGSGFIKASLGKATASIPTVVGNIETVIDDFETVKGSFLRYPAEVIGDYTLSENAKFGNLSGKLSYDFTTTDATRAAYLLFNDGGITLPQRPAKIGLWVFGNEGGGHMLKARLSDANGAIHTIDLAANVNWPGWRYVEAAVPSNMQEPIKIQRLYMVQTDPMLKNTGSVFFDNLTASYTVAPPTN